MILQGMKINTWGKNVYVKVPVTNSRGKFMGKVIKKLNNEKIKLNITAVYTSKHTKQILRNIDKKFKNVEILLASTREPYNYLEAKKLGCHIITALPFIIKKIEKFGKTFQKLTVDTVKGFLIDSKKSKFYL